MFSYKEKETEISSLPFWRRVIKGISVHRALSLYVHSESGWIWCRVAFNYIVDPVVDYLIANCKNFEGINCPYACCFLYCFIPDGRTFQIFRKDLAYGLCWILRSHTCNIRIKSFKCLSFSNKPFDISLDLTKRVTFLSLFLEIIYDKLGFNTV